ncbi:hypothetical protein J2W28_006143 [Variovorax boronicumulans]|uniref:hypothetical protein n=1 Tax=Variovorax boronicumulans TaxID=436515 RepID=UPI0027863D00|nr:hypothetical protein [Variovorax boronicumulans]MDP9995827.1 hypothetical protein [Variovorax boronicumulans]MDQ0006969.1 hypothetical protein [Variovorax boronicumulans]MDQ0042830.1 hypothetical protein [Variovorax boronicumulans]
MEFARKLAEGTGAWLQYQHSCNRTGLFSERFLTEPIAEILAAHTNSRVIAEHHHPVLAPLAKGKGAKPSVDFVVLDPYPKVKMAIESKWIGATKPSIGSIMWDLIRLEMIANLDGAECFFLLGGMKRSLDAYFSDESFRGPKNVHQPVLQALKNVKFDVTVAASARHRIPVMKKLFEKYQETEFPHAISTRRTEPFPADCKSNQYQIYVWHVSSKPKRDIFFPGNSKHYVAPFKEKGN